ncbi:hypothetical protein BN168_620158 [Clostridioides difficile CD002]|nr:hypothetical protein BN168_620158 [Clostridioides difficile CD002]
MIMLRFCIKELKSRPVNEKATLKNSKIEIYIRELVL